MRPSNLVSPTASASLRADAWDERSPSMRHMAQPRPVAESRSVPGSIHALGVAYYASADFNGLRPNTQRTYKGIFDRYRDKYGANPVALLEARHIRAQMDAMAATPAAANNMLKVLRAVMRFAVDRGLERAGLPHCSAHGLRKAAARRLAEAGCSAHEIMSITGHQSLKEVERYTREAGRRNLADSAMKRIG